MTSRQRVEAALHHKEPDRTPIFEYVLQPPVADAGPSFVSNENFLIYRFFREETEKLGIDLPVLAPAYAHGTWTDMALMQTMVLEPELVHRFYSAQTTGVIALIKKYHALGIEMVGIGGDFAGTRGPIISPQAYRRFIMPEIKKLSDYIHSLGMLSVNASDGNLWPVIDDFLLGCDVDGYLEIDFFAGMDLGKLKKEFGNRITFFGNLDCGNILSFGTVADVKNHVKDCLRKGQGNGGHILCASNAIIESVPLKNYLVIYEAYREFFGLRGV